jgi:hypothetical protein
MASNRGASGQESDLQNGSWKSRTARALLGDERASALVAAVDDVRSGRAGLSDWRHRTLSADARANRSYIERFKNKHAGQRCVIIGNGPSLRNTDLSLLRNEFTFGLNRIYLLFDELGFQTTFHVVVNQLVVEQCSADFRGIKAPLFTTTPSQRFLEGSAGTAYLRSLAGPRFFKDVTRGIWEGATVTYVAMQLAYHMGFTEVILVGIDHRFAVQGPAHQVVESVGPDDSHFDPNYFGKGFKWQLPDLATSEQAYRLANNVFQRNDRRIVDATVAGALTVFPKMSLERALR